MLFGQSVFQSVLDRLDADEEKISPDEARAAHRIHGLNTGFASTVLEGVSAASARPDQAYLDNLEFGEPFPASAETASAAAGQTPDNEPEAREAPAPEPPVMPPHLARIRPEEVAADLAISSRDTLQSLGDKRRAFAKANHPDGVPSDFRDNATIRMKIANLLIDEAMRRLGPAARLAR